MASSRSALGINPQRVLSAVRHVARAGEVLRCMGELPQWRTIAPAYIGLRSMPLPFTVRTRGGAAFRLTEFYDLETLWQIYCRGVYDVDRRDRVIVDAGANIGLFTTFAASRAPEAVVHAIEPFPATFARLVDTVRVNGLGARVVCHPIALSSTPGVAAMTAAAEATQMFHLVADPSELSSSVTVQTTTLEAFLASIDEPAIDLLKMDIEGSEYDVLLSTPCPALARARRLDLEFHRPRTRSGDKRVLVAHLRDAGFRLREDHARAGDYGIFHFVR